MRFYETIPGTLTWATLVAMFLFSWLMPTWVSVFIILFDTYWLLKTVFLSFHLRATFVEMRKNMKIDWLARVEALPFAEDKGDWREFFQLIILPMYNEPYEVVQESFESILRVQYPKDRMMVVLALEARAGEKAEAVGRRIEKEYGDAFHKFLITKHPTDLPGEIPGKGSNEAWAAARAKELIVDPLRIPYRKILVSVFDVDTQIYAQYFSRLMYVFLTTKADPLRAIYQPIPLFNNNIHEAPALARVVSFSCTFWQMMQQSRPERLTSFSSQSIPFQALVDIGFWRKNIVSEDSQIFWQGYFHYHGAFRVEPLFFPVSMDAPIASTFWSTLKNIYKQQRRWAWGAENIPYILDGFGRDPVIPQEKRWYWTFNAIEGYHSWATNSLLIFALGWLPLFLGGHHFNTTLLSYNLPHITRFIITLSMIGVASSAVLSIVLLPERLNGVGAVRYAWYFLQWLLMPFTLIIFGAIPGIEAQTRLMLGGKYRLGFWVTPKSRG